MFQHWKFLSYHGSMFKHGSKYVGNIGRTSSQGCLNVKHPQFKKIEGIQGM
jgi:hypothetical protein